MKPIHTLLCLLCSAALCQAADSAGKGAGSKATTQPAASQPATTQPSATGPKKPIKVEKDGFPSGHSSPEGVACDLARAFINRDPKLFRETCIASSGDKEKPSEYEQFLQKMEAAMKAEAEKTEPSPGGPKMIAKLYAARHLSLNGPASAGYALYNLNDVMFVDVGVVLQNGRKALNRTLVLQKADGKWYVHPAPSLVPLLSAGLNDETKSEKDFTEVYEVQK